MQSITFSLSTAIKAAYVLRQLSISKLAGTLSLILKEDALVGRFYMLEDKTIEKYVLLGRSLEIQYGEPVKDVSDIADFIEIMEISYGRSIDRKRLEEAVSQWIDAVMMKSWKADAGYSIALLLMRTEGEIYTVLGFIQSSDKISGCQGGVCDDMKNGLFFCREQDNIIISYVIKNN